MVSGKASITILVPTILLALSGGPAFALPIFQAPVRNAPAENAQRGPTQPGSESQTQIQYINREWSFDNVDAANLVSRLNQIGITLPVQLRGKISGKVQVGVPWGAILDARAWRLGGTLTSGSLKIDDRLLENVIADINYRDGILSLSKLRVTVPQPVDANQPAPAHKAAGELRGSARMELLPTGKFTAQLNATDLPLAAINVDTLQPVGGTISGQLTAQAPVADLRSRAAWQINGPVTGKGVTVRNLAAVDGQFVFDLKDDVVRVQRLKAVSGSVGLTGDAKLNLSAPGPWLLAAQLDANDPQTSGQHLAGLLPLNIQKLLRDRFRGTGRLTTSVTGTLIPFSLNARGKFVGTKLQIRTDDSATETPAAEFVRFDRVETDYVLDQTALTVSDLKAVGPDISVTGVGKLAFDDALTWDFTGAIETPAAEITVKKLRRFIPEKWQKLIVEVKGSIQVAGKFRGTTHPATIAGDGVLSAQNSQIRLVESIAEPMGLRRLDIRSLKSSVAIHSEAVRFDNVLAEAANGRIRGLIEWPLLGDDRSVRVELVWDEIEPRLLFNKWVDTARQSSGSITASFPRVDPADRKNWQASGRLTLDRFAIASVALSDLVIQDLRLENGILRTPDLKAIFAGGALAMDGEIGIHAPWSFRSQLSVPNFDLAGLATLPQLQDADLTFGGNVKLDGKFDGTIKPLRLNGKGDVSGQNVAVNDYTLDQLTSSFDLNPSVLAVTDFRATAYTGHIAGNGRLPLKPDVDGSVALAFSDIESQGIAARFQLPFQPGGRISGNVDAKIPAGHRNDPAGWTMDLALQVPAIRMNEHEIGNFQASAQQRDRRISYSATGGLLGGQLIVRGQRTTPVKTASTPPATEGATQIGSAELRLTDASLRDAVNSFHRRLSNQPVSGSINLKLAVRESSVATDWDGTIELGRTTIGRVELSDGLRGRIRRDQTSIRLEDLSGTLAGGRFKANIALDPGRSDGVSFDVSLRSTQLSRLRMLDPSISRLPISGFADFQLSGRSGRVWTARGTAMSGLGKYGKLQFDRVRIPVTMMWSPSTNRLRAESTSFSAALARGRVGGKLSVEFTPRLELRGDCRFRDLELARVVREFIPHNRSARGRVNGSLMVHGRNVRSVRDLNATLVSDLRNTQAFSMPILSGMPALIPGTSAATSFNKGRLEARLNQGVVDVTRLSLSNPQLAIFVDGKLNDSGRLRLNAVVSTVTEQNIALAQYLVTRAAAATPAGWILLANDYLSNRTIHVEIHGTVRKPILRIKPFESLQEEAARFLVRQAIGVPIPQANVR